MKKQISTGNNLNPMTSLSLNTEKKAWQQPKITQLNVRNTKGGSYASPVEFEWEFISLHS